MKDVSQVRTLLAGGIAGLLGLVAAALLFGRALRSRLSGPSGSQRQTGRSANWTREPQVTPMPMGMARTLTESGAVTPQQLAVMSPAEREFFVATVASQLGKGAKPRLVGGAGAKAAGDPSAPSSRGGDVVPASSAAPAASIEPVSVSALVSGPIHCPVCRTPVGERTVTPLLMTKCSGCGRRVSARVEGDKLTVTVNYGKGTPVLGTAAIRPN